MASYPNSTYSPRTRTNKSGVIYTPSKQTVLFANDINNSDAEIVAIETELGANPKGTKATVKARLDDVDSAISGKAAAADLSNHTGNTSNPHSVTKTQVGLGNCDNTSDASKPVSTAQQTALNAKADKSQEEWITVTSFTNGWNNYDNSHVTLDIARYMKDSLGFVHLKGFVVPGTSGTAMFTLPTGYRPDHRMVWASYDNGNIGWVRVESNGDVVGIGVSHASLDAVIFRAV
jgi:hypothetical protein